MKGTIASMVLSAALNPEPVIEPLPSVVKEGCAQTKEQALDQAFRRAIEFHSGSVIVNEAQVRGDRLVKTETLDYSAGRVEKFEIRNEYRQDKKICVTAEIWVDKSRIGHRAMVHNSSEQQFSGDQHSGQINSHRQEHLRGDRLLSHVIQDYPVRAYNIAQTDYTLTIDRNRQAVLRVPYTVSWNPNFLVAVEDTFKETLEPLSRQSIGSEPVMAVAISHPTTSWIGSKKTWLIDDYHRAQVIYQHFKRVPAIALTLTDQYSRKLHTSCWEFASADSRGFITRDSRHVRMYGNFVEKNVIQETLPAELVQKISRVTGVQLKIVDSSECR